MKKTIAVVIGVLALTFATSGVAVAGRPTNSGGGPTQTGSLSCQKGGLTRFTSTTGAVQSVQFEWKDNRNVVIATENGVEYGLSDFRWYNTLANAKTVTARVTWKSSLEITTYGGSCFT